MFQFKAKSQQQTEQKPDGQDFLSEAQEHYRELFSNFSQASDEYDSFDVFMSSLETQAWEMTEQLLKASYANGVKRSRGAKGRTSRYRPANS